MARSDQNAVELTLTPEQLTALDNALTALEQATSTLPTFTAEAKRRLAKPPEGASEWMNYIMNLAAQNAGKMAADFSPTALEGDLDLEAVLGPRAVRLMAVWKRINDTIFGGNSDAWVACLNARNVLRGRNAAPPDDPRLSKGLTDYFQRHDKGGSESSQATPGK